MATVSPLARVAVMLPAVGALAFFALAASGAFSHGGASPGGRPSGGASPSASPSRPGHSPSPGQQAGLGAPAYKTLGGERVCVSGCHYLGVAMGNVTTLAPFVSSTGVRPKIVQTYASFGAPFPLTVARQMVSQGYIPQIQIDPVHTSLAAIAAGQYDSYLTSYSAGVRRVRGPVVLSFAHEMNGSWYPWGCGRTSAQDFIAAYRRVVRVIRQAGVHNVIWMWTANVTAPGDCPIGARYPGDRYVTWVGIDGYMRKPGRTYTGIFGQTLTQIRQFTQRPILLSETGVLIGVPGAPGRITDLFRGAAASPGVIGVVYFDSQTHKYGDYKPQDNPATLAAFRRATSRYLAGR